MYNLHVLPCGFMQTNLDFTFSWGGLKDSLWPLGGTMVASLSPASWCCAGACVYSHNVLLFMPKQQFNNQHPDHPARIWRSPWKSLVKLNKDFIVRVVMAGRDAINVMLLVLDRWGIWPPLTFSDVIYFIFFVPAEQLNYEISLSAAFFFFHPIAFHFCKCYGVMGPGAAVHTRVGLLPTWARGSQAASGGWWRRWAAVTVGYTTLQFCEYWRLFDAYVVAIREGIFLHHLQEMNLSKSPLYATAITWKILNVFEMNVLWSEPWYLRDAFK